MRGLGNVLARVFAFTGGNSHEFGPLKREPHHHRGHKKRVPAARKGGVADGPVRPSRGSVAREDPSDHE